LSIYRVCLPKIFKSQLHANITNLDNYTKLSLNIDMVQIKTNKLFKFVARIKDTRLCRYMVN